MDAPWLTVALTTYNARDYLTAALQSIVAQGDPGVPCEAGLYMPRQLAHDRAITPIGYPNQ
jgi:hypothetical protein